MQVIEGTIIGTGGRGRGMWMNVRTVAGDEYRGTIPASLMLSAIPGAVVRFRVSYIHGREFGNPRDAELLGAR